MCTKTAKGYKQSQRLTLSLAAWRLVRVQSRWPMVSERVVLGVRLPKMSQATAHRCQCCSGCTLVDTMIPVVAVVAVVAPVVAVVAVVAVVPVVAVVYL